MSNFVDNSTTNTKDLRNNNQIHESVILIEDINIKAHDTEEHMDKVNLSETDNFTDTLTSNKDIVLDIAVTEPSSRNNVRRQQKTWVYSQYFTKHLWQQGRQRFPQQGGQQPYYSDAWTQYAGTGGQAYSGNDYEGTPLMYDPETRNSFVRLVMMITLVMLLLTAAFLTFVLMSPDVKKFFYRNSMVFLFIGLAILMIPNYGMMCFPMLRRAPCSFFMLFLALCAMNLMSASITCHYKTEIILQAVIATAVIVLVCLGLACTSFDFTKYILFVIVIMMGLCVAGMIVFATGLILGRQMTTWHIVILILVVIVQAVMLVIELQMILGGKSLELDEEDYALGAFMLYTSIIDIFLKMVQILGLIDH